MLPFNKQFSLSGHISKYFQYAIAKTFPHLNVQSPIEEKINSSFPQSPPISSSSTTTTTSSSSLPSSLVHEKNEEIHSMFEGLRLSSAPPLSIIVTPCAQKRYGDYQTAAAMQIQKQIEHERNSKVSPVNIAMEVKKMMETCDINDQFPIVSSSGLRVSGPGFLTIQLNRQYVANLLVKNLLSDNIPNKYHDKGSWSDKEYVAHQINPKVIVDFSSPNVAKKMHVGHLRSTIIGDSICRVLEYTGNYDVERVNHIGDFGTQFGMLVAYIKDLSSRQSVQHLLTNIDEIHEMYRVSANLFKKDAQFRNKAHLEVISLQNHSDLETLNIWKTICNTSIVELHKIYKKLNIKIEEKGESFYGPLLKTVISDLESKNLVSKQPDGAKMIFFTDKSKENCEERTFPLILQKSDGGFTYDTTDLAALWYRLNEEKAKWLVYVVDAGQASHFNMIFKAGLMANWYDEKQVRIDHAAFGVVQGEDGRKLKTRSGDLINLETLLDEAHRRAKERMIEKSLEKNVNTEENHQKLDELQLEHASRVVGYSAVKYADLKNNRITDYTFSFDRMLDFKGNTAVYLLYSYARIKSIIDKAGVPTSELIREQSSELIHLEHDTEWQLALRLMKFKEVVETVIQNLEPHHLCDYLYELCNVMNAFHRDCRVIDQGNVNISRLLLCEATINVMSTCFDLLGLEKLDRL